MSSRADLVRAFIPPIVWHYGKRRLPWLVRALGGHYTHIKFSGDYPDFAAAREKCTGYDHELILSRTREAMLKVKRGENRWEQDGMVSDSEEMPWPLLAFLLRIAAQKQNRDLRVLDFGGSLGTLYFWSRPYFPPEIALTWHVVEQKAHVDVGRADFQDRQLRFDYSVDDVIQQGAPDALILSGVLHFLPDPEKFLWELLDRKIPHFVIDRTPLWDHDRHRLTIQEVPPEIYAASYPAWFLSRQKILALIETRYRLIQRAPSSEAWEIDGESVPSAQWQFVLR